jgi:hypothetical protein
VPISVFSPVFGSSLICIEGCDWGLCGPQQQMGLPILMSHIHEYQCMPRLNSQASRSNTRPGCHFARLDMPELLVLDDAAHALLGEYSSETAAIFQS